MYKKRRVEIKVETIEGSDGNVVICHARAIVGMVTRYGKLNLFHLVTRTKKNCINESFHSGGGLTQAFRYMRVVVPNRVALS